MVRRMPNRRIVNALSAYFETKRARRPWREELHPRDSKGRFVETGGIARIWGGGFARVLRALSQTKVQVSDLDGRNQRPIQTSRLTMVTRPDGSAPTKSKAKVQAEEDRRDADPRRGDGHTNDDHGDPDTSDAPHATDDEGKPIGGDAAHEPRDTEPAKAPRFATVAAARNHLDSGTKDARWTRPPRTHNGVHLRGASQQERAQVRIDTYSARRGMDFARTSQLSSNGNFLVTRHGKGKWDVYHVGSGTIMTHQAGFRSKPDALHFANELENARDDRGRPFDWEAPHVADRLDMANGRDGIDAAIARGRERHADRDNNEHQTQTPAAPVAEQPQLGEDDGQGEQRNDSGQNEPVNDGQPEAPAQQEGDGGGRPTTVAQVLAHWRNNPDVPRLRETHNERKQREAVSRQRADLVTDPQVVDGFLIGRMDVRGKQRWTVFHAGTSVPVAILSSDKGKPDAIARAHAYRDYRDEHGHPFDWSSEGIGARLDSPAGKRMREVTSGRTRHEPGGHENDVPGDATELAGFPGYRMARGEDGTNVYGPDGKRIATGQSVFDRNTRRSAYVGDVGDRHVSGRTETDFAVNAARQHVLAGQPDDQKDPMWVQYSPSRAVVHGADRHDPDMHKRLRRAGFVWSDGAKAYVTTSSTRPVTRALAVDGLVRGLADEGRQIEVRRDEDRLRTPSTDAPDAAPDTSAVTHVDEPATPENDDSSRATATGSTAAAAAPDTTRADNQSTPNPITGDDSSGDEQAGADRSGALADVPARGVRGAGDGRGEGDLLRDARDAGQSGDHKPDGADPVPAADQRVSGRSEGQGAGAGAGQGTRDGRADLPAGGARNGERRAAGSRQGVAAPSFRPTSQRDLAPSGEKGKARANVAAVQLLRQIQAENRPATADEQKVLARWSGWGSLPIVLADRPQPTDGNYRDKDGNPDPAKYARALKKWESFAKERAAVRELLDDKEWAAAKANTLNAHYTDNALVQPVWDLLRELGFDGGNVLEPGSGSGNFIGAAPDNTRITGVELDPTSAAISQLLYPNAQIINQSFGDLRLPDGHFDAVVGNVPFGRFPLYDEQVNPDAKHSIHDTFILKSLAKVRPGGLVAVITSRFTLDGEDDTARRQMANMGDLVGAVRLPAGAHQEAAGTGVVTDLLVFRRRLADENQHATDLSWLSSSKKNINGHEIAVNDYFQRHPRNVLGELTTGRGQFSGHDLTVIGDKEVTLPALRAAMERITSGSFSGGRADRMRYVPEINAVGRDLELAGEKHEGAVHVLSDGSFTQVDEGAVVPLDVHPTQQEHLRKLLGLRDLTNQLLRLEGETREPGENDRMRALRSELNRAYDAYAAAHGPLDKPGQTRFFTPQEAKDRAKAEGLKSVPDAWKLPTALQLFEDDPSSAVAFGLDKWDDGAKAGRKADIFSQRVLAPREIADRADSPEQAIALALELDGGELHLPTIARLLGSTDLLDVREQIGPLAFDEPGTNRLVSRGEYLSGNVRVKLAQAQEAAASNPQFAANVAALKNVIPRDLDPSEIKVKMGAPWIPETDITAFLQHILGTKHVRAEHGGGSMWEVDGPTTGIAATSDWGTAAKPAPDVAKALLEQRTITVTKTVKVNGRETSVTDDEATSAAQSKAKEMADRFSEWVWEDPERSKRLARVYNDRFNNLVMREFDDSPLALPGAIADWKMRPHQNAAIRRIVTDPSVLLAHVVGAGKTATMVAGTQELRRTGLARKPAIIVPNHMLGQFRREYLELYPDAKLLTASSTDLTGKRRRRFVAKAATGDWDAVILTQGAFERIPMRVEAQEKYMRRELEQLESQITRAKGRQGQSLTLKRLEETLKRSEEKLKRKLAAKTDQGTVHFEDTGIDYLMVDEAHGYKNLATASHIEGASIAGSARASDLHMKIDYLRGRNESGRVVTLATGTPIANSVTEAYVMQRYLRPDILEDAGIDDFDNWAATFGEIIQNLELAPDGSGFRMKARFARFHNAAELLRMYRLATDVQTAADLGLPTPPVRKNAEGKRGEIVTVPISAEQKAFVTALPNAKWIHDKGGILKAIGLASRAAIDMRLVGGDGDEGGKIDYAVQKISEIYEENKNRIYPVSAKDHTPQKLPGSVQIVFMDSGTPGSKAKNAWDAYDHMKQELIQAGLPAEKIRFIHEAKTDKAKAKLFEDARNGKIAVLIGSTEKMGTGTNIQDRAVALHHMDFPWRPADMAQREGRIERQGNLNMPEIPGTADDVRIISYVTEETFDAFKLGTLERKATFIAQMDRKDFDAREMEDIGDIAVSFGQMKAIATGDMTVMQFAEANADVVDLQRLDRNWHRDQDQRRATIRVADHMIGGLSTVLPAWRDALSRRQDVSGDKFHITLGGDDFDQRPDVWRGLADAVRAAARDMSLRDGDRVPLGSLGGHDFHVEIGHDQFGNRVAKVRFDWPDWEHPDEPDTRGVYTPSQLADVSGRGILASLERRLANLDDAITDAEETLEIVQDERARAARGLGGSSPYGERLRSKERRRGLLSNLITANEKVKAYNGRQANPNDKEYRKAKDHVAALKSELGIEDQREEELDAQAAAAAQRAVDDAASLDANDVKRELDSIRPEGAARAPRQRSGERAANERREATSGGATAGTATLNREEVDDELGSTQPESGGSGSGGSARPPRPDSPQGDDETPDAPIGTASPRSLDDKALSAEIMALIGHEMGHGPLTGAAKTRLAALEAERDRRAGKRPAREAPSPTPAPQRSGPGGNWTDLTSSDFDSEASGQDDGLFKPPATPQPNTAPDPNNPLDRPDDPFGTSDMFADAEGRDTSDLKEAELRRADKLQQGDRYTDNEGHTHTVAEPPQTTGRGRIRIRTEEGRELFYRPSDEFRTGGSEKPPTTAADPASTANEPRTAPSSPDEPSGAPEAAAQDMLARSRGHRPSSGITTFSTDAAWLRELNDVEAAFGAVSTAADSTWGRSDMPTEEESIRTAIFTALAALEDKDPDAAEASLRDARSQAADLLDGLNEQEHQTVGPKLRAFLGLLDNFLTSHRHTVERRKREDAQARALEEQPAHATPSSTAGTAKGESSRDQFAAVRSLYEGEMIPASDVKRGDWVHTVSADPAHNEPMHMVGRVIHVTPVLSNGHVRIEVEAHVTLNGRDTVRTEFALFRATDVVERLPEGNPGREDSSDLRRRIEASDGQRLAAKVRVPEGWQAVDGSQVEPRAGDRFRIVLRQGTPDSKYWNVTVAGPAEREGYWRVEGQELSFRSSDIVAVPKDTDMPDGNGHTPAAEGDGTPAAADSAASAEETDARRVSPDGLTAGDYVTAQTQNSAGNMVAREGYLLAAPTRTTVQRDGKPVQAWRLYIDTRPDIAPDPRNAVTVLDGETVERHADRKIDRRDQFDTLDEALDHWRRGEFTPLRGGHARVEEQRRAFAAGVADRIQNPELAADGRAVVGQVGGRWYVFSAAGGDLLPRTHTDASYADHDAAVHGADNPSGFGVFTWAHELRRTGLSEDDFVRSPQSGDDDDARDERPADRQRRDDRRNRRNKDTDAPTGDGVSPAPGGSSPGAAPGTSRGTADRDGRHADAPSNAPSYDPRSPRFRNLKALRDHLRAGKFDPYGPSSGTFGATRATTARWADVADADLALSPNKRLLVVKNPLSNSNPWEVRVPGSMRRLIHEGYGHDGSGEGFSSKKVAMRAAIALEGVRDAAGDPFPWDAPDVAERAAHFRDSSGHTLDEAMALALAGHMPYPQYPDRYLSGADRARRQLAFRRDSAAWNADRDFEGYTVPVTPGVDTLRAGDEVAFVAQSPDGKVVDGRIPEGVVRGRLSEDAYTLDPTGHNAALGSNLFFRVSVADGGQWTGPDGTVLPFSKGALVYMPGGIRRKPRPDEQHEASGDARTLTSRSRANDSDAPTAARQSEDAEPAGLAALRDAYRTGQGLPSSIAANAVHRDFLSRLADNPTLTRSSGGGLVTWTDDHTDLAEGRPALWRFAQAHSGASVGGSGTSEISASSADLARSLADEYEQLADADGKPFNWSGDLDPATVRSWRDQEGRTLPQAMRATRDAFEARTADGDTPTTLPADLSGLTNEELEALPHGEFTQEDWERFAAEMDRRFPPADSLRDALPQTPPANEEERQAENKAMDEALGFGDTDMASEIVRPKPQSRQQALRDEYQLWSEGRFNAAEHAMRGGSMVNRAGRQRGYSDNDVFNGGFLSANNNWRRYASDELLEWFDNNGGRVTYNQYREQARTSDRLDRAEYEAQQQGANVDPQGPNDRTAARDSAAPQSDSGPTPARPASAPGADAPGTPHSGPETGENRSAGTSAPRKKQDAAAQPVTDPEAQRPEPDPVGGRVAEWVSVGDLALGDVVRIEGTTRNGKARTLWGYVIQAPQQRPVSRKGRSTTMFMTLISSTADGSSGSPVWTPLDASAARATGEPDTNRPDSSLISGAESDVLTGQVPDRVAADPAGRGLFPGTLVHDGNGREGVVTGANSTSASVQWNDGKEETGLTPTSLNVVDGGAARPAGWTGEGQHVREGHVVSDRAGNFLGTVEEVDGDTAQVATREGITATPVTELRTVGEVRDGNSTPDDAAHVQSTTAGDLREGDVIVHDGDDGPSTATVIGRSTDGDRVQLDVADTRTGEIQHIDTTAKAPANRLVDQNGQAPAAGSTPDNGDLQVTDPAEPVDPVTGPTVDPALSPEERDAIADHGTAPSDDTDVQQAAARIGRDLPVTPDQAAALADSLRAAATPDTAEGRAAQRAADHLDAAAGRTPDADGARPAPGRVDDLGEGDTIALPDENDPDNVTAYKVVTIQDLLGGVRQVTVEDSAGNQHSRTLPGDQTLWQLPELPAADGPDGAPRDPNTPPSTDDIVAGHPHTVARAVVDTAIAGTATPGSIHQLRQQIAERLTTDNLLAPMQQARQEAVDALNAAGITGRERAQAFQRLKAARVRARAAAVRAVLRTINDLEPLDGESEQDAATRAADLLRLIPGQIGAPTHTAGTGETGQTVARHVDDALMAAARNAFGDGLSDEDALRLGRVLTTRMDATRQATARRILRHLPPAQRQRLLPQILALLIRIGRRIAAMVRALIKAAGRVWNAEAFRRFRERLVARVKAWPESRRLHRLAQTADLPNPGAGSDLGERIAHWARLLPAPGRLGQASRRARWYERSTRRALATGELPRVQDGVRWAPDRAADRGPGAAAMRHLAALRAAGTDMDSEINTRLAAARPELGDDPHANLRLAAAYADTAERRARDLAAHPVGHSQNPDYPMELAAARAEAADARTEADRMREVYSAALPDVVADALASVREMGLDGTSALVLDPGSDSEAARALTAVQRFIPRDWLAPADRRFLTARTSDTGGYDAPSRTVSVADLGDNGLGSAAYALLMHLQEAQPDITAAQEIYRFTRTHTGRLGRGAAATSTCCSRVSSGPPGRAGPTWPCRRHFSPCSPATGSRTTTFGRSSSDCSPPARKEHDEMMVTGVLEDGSPYQVQITGQAERPVIGSARIRALVEQYKGTPVLLGRLGPLRDLDPADSQAVLALLRQRTRLIEQHA